MSEETGQRDNLANNGDVRLKSATSAREYHSPIPFTDGTSAGDNVQTGIVSENEEGSGETPRSTEQLTGQKPQNMEEGEDQDHLVKQSEFTKEKPGGAITHVVLPDHHNLSAEPPGSAEETVPDSVPTLPNEEHGDKTTEINQQPSVPFGDSLLLDSPQSEGDGPQELEDETQDGETSSAEHGRPTSAYTTSYEEYALLLEQLTEERANAIEHNKKLQMKLAPILAKTPREEMERLTQGEVSAESYEENLEMLTELKLNIKKDREMVKRQKEELKMQVQERLSKADGEWRDLLSLKKGVAEAALGRRWSRPAAAARVERALASEERRRDELTRLRLQNFGLENRIRRLELEIRRADRHATNPFQREYEKLHAQRTQEKRRREERHREALGARRRGDGRLQMLSNVKQKLRNTETEVQHQLEKLLRADAILARQRHKLASLKQTRSSLQRYNARLTEQRGLMGNEVLLRDYDFTKRANAALEEKLQDLKCLRAHLQAGFRQRDS